jgi:hypothetical protein
MPKDTIKKLGDPRFDRKQPAPDVFNARNEHNRTLKLEINRDLLPINRFRDFGAHDKIACTIRGYIIKILSSRREGGHCFMAVKIA